MPDTFGNMLKRAWKWHWNLLFVGAGTVFAFLSGDPGTVLPLVGAAELAYLGFLGSNPRFQKILRSREIAKTPPPLPGQQVQLARLLQFLTPEESRRFETLKERCSALLGLRSRLEATGGALEESSFRAESLDRMLWVFLKLLHQKAGLDRFLAATHREDLDADLKEAESQLARARTEAAHNPVTAERQAAALEEKIGTIRERLANHDRAAENLTLLGIELDKTEQKIHHVCEVGMTGGDSSALSAQIESISHTLRNSEADYVPASVRMLLEEDSPPPILGQVLE